MRETSRPLQQSARITLKLPPIVFDRIIWASGLDLVTFVKYVTVSPMWGFPNAWFCDVLFEL